MTESFGLGHPTGNVGTGSTLLFKDLVPLDNDETRNSSIIFTRMVNVLGIDISADQNCTVTVTRYPDGETAGASSTVGAVEAGVPAFFTYSALLCPAVKITVANTGGAAMTDFAMYVRGGA